MLVCQDGNTFYLYKHKNAERAYKIETAPFKVTDYDTTNAQRARQWFIDKHPRATITFL